MTTELLNIIVENRELAATLLTILLGSAGSVEHYRRTGRIPLGRLPLRAIQDAWGELADTYFGRSRPQGVPGLLVETTVDDLDTRLRENAHFEGADDTSFEYDGEALNLRQPNGRRRHPDTGELVPMELHVRAFPTDRGSLFVLAHDEASRSEAWAAHIREKLLSWDRGQQQTAATLDDVEIDSVCVESERAADVTVTSNQSA